MTNRRMTRLAALLTVALLCIATGGRAQDAVFNYNGRLSAEGVPFTGDGLFKFAIVNAPGTVSLWSNDGTSVAGAEPTSYTTISVHDGFFSVTIGDPADGMDPINATIFNRKGAIFLRTWFSDGVHAFELLHPDTNIVNADLIGLETGDQAFELYVDATAGSDENDGLTTDTALATIQEAVDRLPLRINADVTVRVLPGVYREEVEILNIACPVGVYVTILGDTGWTRSGGGSPTVRITGADSDSPSTAVRTYGMTIMQCDGIKLEGLLVDYASSHGIFMRRSTVNLTNCLVENNGSFGIGSGSGTMGMQDCVVRLNGQDGLSLNDCQVSYLYGCECSDNGRYGLYLSKTAQVRWYDWGLVSGNGSTGILVADNSSLAYGSGYSGTIENNAGPGIELIFMSYSNGHTSNAFNSNGGGNISVGTGCYTY